MQPSQSGQEQVRLARHDTGQLVMAPTDTVVAQITQFFTGILSRSSQTGGPLYSITLDLVQHLVNGIYDVDTFLDRLQTEWRSSPLPIIAPLLKAGMDSFRAGLISGSLRVHGIFPPSLPNVQQPASTFAFSHQGSAAFETQSPADTVQQALKRVCDYCAFMLGPVSRIKFPHHFAISRALIQEVVDGTIDLEAFSRQTESALQLAPEITSVLKQALQTCLVTLREELRRGSIVIEHIVPPAMPAPAPVSRLFHPFTHFTYNCGNCGEPFPDLPDNIIPSKDMWYDLHFKNGRYGRQCIMDAAGNAFLAAEGPLNALDIVTSKLVSEKAHCGLCRGREIESRNMESHWRGAHGGQTGSCSSLPASNIIPAPVHPAPGFSQSTPALGAASSRGPQYASHPSTTLSDPTQGLERLTVTTTIPGATGLSTDGRAVVFRPPEPETVVVDSANAPSTPVTEITGLPSMNTAATGKMSAQADPRVDPLPAPTAKSSVPETLVTTSMDVSQTETKSVSAQPGPAPPAPAEKSSVPETPIAPSTDISPAMTLLVQPVSPPATTEKQSLCIKAQMPETELPATIPASPVAVPSLKRTDSAISNTGHVRLRKKVRFSVQDDDLAEKKSFEKEMDSSPEEPDDMDCDKSKMYTCSCGEVRFTEAAFARHCKRHIRKNKAVAPDQRPFLCPRLNCRYLAVDTADYALHCTKHILLQRTFRARKSDFDDCLL